MPSVALSVLETLRKDSFDEQFDWLPGTRFERAYPTSGGTVPAHGSLFTGKFLSETGVYAKSESLTPEEPVLAEALAEAGYMTRGSSANANVSDAFAFTRSFQEFHHSWRGAPQKERVVDWGEFISDTADDGVEEEGADRLIEDPRNGFQSVKPQSPQEADLPTDGEDRLAEMRYL